MSSILDLLTSQLGGGAIDQIARSVGGNREQVGSVVSGALPVLMGALAKNAASREGAAGLAGALERDHDGSILDNLGAFLGGGDASPGQAILGHVLGGRQPVVERSLAKSSGLDIGQVGQILAMLAPLVMGMLGKQKRQAGLDIGGLAEMLGGERKRMERKEAGLGGLLGSLLDSDGDGSAADDIAKIGGGLLGKLFK
jgi:hypothetical protein